MSSVAWVEMSWFELNRVELRWASCVESVDLRVALSESRLADLSWKELSWDEWVVLSQVSCVEISRAKLISVEFSCVSWVSSIEWVELSWVQLIELIWVEIRWDTVSRVELSCVSWDKLIWVEMSWFELNGVDLSSVALELSWDEWVVLS